MRAQDARIKWKAFMLHNLLFTASWAGSVRVNETSGPSKTQEWAIA